MYNNYRQFLPIALLLVLASCVSSVPATSHTLSVTAQNGVVTSTPSGIDCGTNCTADFAEDKVVSLSAAADTGYSFKGWSGACSGAAACDVTMTADKTVTTIFAEATTPSGSSVTIAAAGDIACSPLSDANYNGGAGSASHCQMKATSDLVLERNVDAVLTLGDNQYSQGRLGAFEGSYETTWGRLKDITFPIPGNHEYLTSQGSGYYDYFGERAGDPKKGYYSYDLGNWHLIALNSNCGSVGGCGVDSAQGQWLEQDLLDHPNACTLAYWHHPRFSSGRHGSNATYSDFWDILYHAGADLVLDGHDHTYERFAPQDSAGNADAKGIREFVVGTGGVGFYDVKKPEANSEKVITGEFGVLFLTLDQNSYTWSFVSTSGETLDRGTGSCG